MKVIDLLNTPLNELPQKIKVEDKTYTLFIDEDTDYHYYQDDECKYFMFSISCFEELNEKIEVIEKDKKIEKLPTNNGMLYATDGEMTLVVNKINEIIDKINESETK